jgi:hypothetical protein
LEASVYGLFWSRKSRLDENKQALGFLEILRFAWISDTGENGDVKEVAVKKIEVHDIKMVGPTLVLSEKRPDISTVGASGSTTKQN